MKTQSLIAAIMVFGFGSTVQADEKLPSYGWRLGAMQIGGAVNDRYVRDFISAYILLANISLTDEVRATSGEDKFLLLAIGPDAKFEDQVKSEYLPGSNQLLNDALRAVDLCKNDCTLIKILEKFSKKNGSWGFLDLNDTTGDQSIVCILYMIMESAGIEFDEYLGMPVNEVISATLADFSALSRPAEIEE